MQNPDEWTFWRVLVRFVRNPNYRYLRTPLPPFALGILDLEYDTLNIRKQFWIWKNKPLKNFFSGKLSMNLCQSVRLDYTFHTFRILSFTGMKWMGRVVCLNAFLFQILYSKWFKIKMFKNAPIKYTKCTIPNTPFKIMIPLYCMCSCILVYRGLVCM